MIFEIYYQAKTMSGHSKWSKIKHQKAINDAKKGKVFSKLAQQISIAARDGGGDSDSNFTLRLLMDKAKAVSMPAENVKRAVDRGSGKSGESMTLEHVTYEGFGPERVSIIVETLTDNKNRTVSDLRQTFNENGGNLGESGSVSWNFNQKGLILIRPAKLKKSEKYGGEDEAVEENIEEVMLTLMEIEGILDIQESQDEDSVGNQIKTLELYTDPKQLAHVRDSIYKIGYIVESIELVWIPKMYKEDVENISRVRDFIETIEDLDDVQNVWSDLA